jgi:hypothetical protein
MFMAFRLSCCRPGLAAKAGKEKAASMGGLVSQHGVLDQRE